jgi:hypothetical protein
MLAHIIAETCAVPIPTAIHAMEFIRFIRSRRISATLAQVARPGASLLVGRILPPNAWAALLGSISVVRTVTAALLDGTLRATVELLYPIVFIAQREPILVLGPVPAPAVRRASTPPVVSTPAPRARKATSALEGPAGRAEHAQLVLIKIATPLLLAKAARPALTKVALPRLVASPALLVGTPQEAQATAPAALLVNIKHPLVKAVAPFAVKVRTLLALAIPVALKFPRGTIRTVLAPAVTTLVL